ncbi:hypothetical protein Vafri_7272, partial [Volvox africanus]
GHTLADERDAQRLGSSIGWLSPTRLPRRDMSAMDSCEGDNKPLESRPSQLTWRTSEPCSGSGGTFVPSREFGGSSCEVRSTCGRSLSCSMEGLSTKAGPGATPRPANSC